VGPQAEIHVRRRHHRVARDEEPDAFHGGMLQEHRPRFHVLSVEDGQRLPDHRRQFLGGGPPKGRRVELREQGVAGASLVEPVEGHVPLVVQA